MGFEPTLPEGNGLAVHRLNHSATSSDGHSKIDCVKNSIKTFQLTNRIFVGHPLKRNAYSCHGVAVITSA